MSYNTAFLNKLSNFVKNGKRSMHDLTRIVVLDMATEVVERSPVGNPELWAEGTYVSPGYVGGRFRGNWQYGENMVPQGVMETIDPSGATSVARFVGGLSPQAGGKIHYIVNNLPYAKRLEDGWSTQAPQGMVALTVLRFNAIVSSAAARVRR